MLPAIPSVWFLEQSKLKSEDGQLVLAPVIWDTRPRCGFLLSLSVLFSSTEGCVVHFPEGLSAPSQRLPSSRCHISHWILHFMVSHYGGGGHRTVTLGKECHFRWPWFGDPTSFVILINWEIVMWHDCT